MLKRYKHSLTEMQLVLEYGTQEDGTPKTSTMILCKGGRTGTKVHLAFAGASGSNCGHWFKYAVGNFKVTAVQADKMVRCEKCFGAKYLEEEAL
jgi:hypothetical protein